MDRIRCLAGGLVLAGLLAGCGGGAGSGSSAELPPDQKDPNYGKNSADEIQKLMPAPGGTEAPSK